MKKILISDYDGTIYQDDLTTKRNVESINEFRKNNIFVVATGRSYEDFLSAVKKYDIRCDYYLLNYGTQVLDKDMNIIYELPLSYLEIDEIYNFFKNKQCQIYYCNEKNNSLQREGKIYKMVLAYEDKEKMLRDYNNFINKYQYNVFILKNHYSIEIVSLNMDKSKAIDFICQKENVTDISVIGDSENDISMIKKYNGYCVLNAVDEVKGISSKMYESVSQLINELLEGELR